MLDRSTIIRQTKKWLSTVIIAQGLCPFAKREFDADSIHYAVIDAADRHSQIDAVLLACEALDADARIETTLLIFPDGLSDFIDYLDALGLANAVMGKAGYSGIYQLASFHPDYIFADVPFDDASHYTNRSPYPMFHILREASVEAALKTHPNPEGIPKRNIALTQRMGFAAVQNLLAQCYE